MFPFFQYSLESAFCLAVLLLPYLAWFRKTTFYQWNRFYLLGAVSFSLLAPLVNIEIGTTTSKVPQLTETLSFFQGVHMLSSQTSSKGQLPIDTKTTSHTPSKIDTLEAVEQTTSWNWEQYAWTIYFLGVSVLGGMLLYRLFMLWRLVHRGQNTKHSTLTIVDLPDDRVFSFFHFVLFDQQRYRGQELTTLLKHEQMHIQQWHSLDVLVLEILQIVFWFNPLYRIYLKFLQQEHEYYVDTAISKKLGQSHYAQLLLSMAVARPPLVGHAFAYIPIKHRICKLLQKPSTTMEKSRFFIAIPIILSLFLVFSCSFDELESIKGDAPLSGQAVKKVQAFFVDEQAEIKNGHLFLEVKFDENGAIIKKRDDSKDITIKNLTDYAHHFIDIRFAISPFEAYSNYIEGLPKNFYPKNVQNLIITDPIFKDVEMLLHHGNMDKFIEMDMISSTNEADYNSIEIDYDGDKIKLYNLEGERETGKNSISMDVTYERDLPTYWKKTREYVPFSTEEIRSVYNKKMSREELKEHLQKQLDNTPSFRGHAFKMEYNSENLLSKLTLFYVNRSGGSGDINERRNSEMHLFYNGSKQLKEIEMYNPEGTYLRKYRFHYNEAGFCTKKELINREGNVEFSVRFIYGFF